MAVAAGIGSIVAGVSPLAAVPVGLLAALFLSLNRVHNGSPGAVDNGSGVVTALATVDALPPEFAVGLMFLDAEEWGLRGARALLRERANLLRDTTVVNFDGIDDRGRPIALVHRPGPAVERIAGALHARRWRWLPVVVDGLALHRGARECVTIMRGDWGTARVVHTPRDTVDRLTLEGVREVASAVASALRATRQGENPRVDAGVTGV
jgi:Zn-dependent M28 family amino/carboxypeptidase